MKDSPLFDGVKNESIVWMSHGDSVLKLPEGFEKIAASNDCEFVAAQNLSKQIYLVQFHPEVVHTEEGKKMLSNFVFKISKANANWNMENFLENEIKFLKENVKVKRLFWEFLEGLILLHLQFLLIRL